MVGDRIFSFGGFDCKRYYGLAIFDPGEFPTHFLSLNRNLPWSEVCGEVVSDTEYEKCNCGLLFKSGERLN